jgi:hypothetical protein
VVGVYALLPPLLEGLVARNLRNGLGLAEKPEVNLTSDPAPSVLLGKFEEGEITLANPELGGVRPDEVKIYLEPFDLDVPASVASGRIKSEVPLSGMLRAELSEREVARLAAFSETLAALVREVRLEEGYIVVELGLRHWGRAFRLAWKERPFCGTVGSWGSRRTDWRCLVSLCQRS